MTVAEFIEKLQKYPQDMHIYHSDYEMGFSEPTLNKEVLDEWDIKADGLCDTEKAGNEVLLIYWWVDKYALH